MKITIKPDKQKAVSLKDVSIITLERLNETDIVKYPTNTLKDYYDIIKSLMEALNYLGGIKFKSDSSHYETIEYICKKYNFNESTRIFIQNMREFRNRISYEGFHVKSNYIIQNHKKIEKIIERLIKLLEKKIVR